MIQHLLLGMLTPLGLVLGAPATLLLRSVSAPTARRISAVLRHGVVRRITHPITALALDVGSLYLIYLTPLYALTRSHPLLHGAVHVHFLAARYLFAFSIAGPDPAQIQDAAQIMYYGGPSLNFCSPLRCSHPGTA
jgi:putative membrane protein